jgi:hypothetical protein
VTGNNSPGGHGKSPGGKRKPIEAAIRAYIIHHPHHVHPLKLAEYIGHFV